MLEFSFSIKKEISRNVSSYPVLLSDVKTFSQFYIDNPTSTKYDSIINSIWIPAFVRDWERSTSFILLDTSIQAFVKNIGTVLSYYADINFDSLNIRSVSSVKYYAESWNQTDDKLTLETAKYSISDEVKNISKKLNIKKDYLPLVLYNKTLNLEANYTCGYAANNFASLPQEIKNAIAMQIAMKIDSGEGLGCDQEFAPFIEQTYAEYTISRQQICFI
jgi:hypothetical protein